MKEKKILLRYGILFVLLTALCWLFPYTGDDWVWGSNVGIDRLHDWFRDYNGRYLGNLSVIVMTRSNLLKALIMSAVLSGIIFCIEKIMQRKWVFYVSCLLLLLLPREIVAQAIVWTSGFSNYTISALLILMYIAYVYPVLSGKLPEKKYWHAVPLFLLGISVVLFMEHITIYTVVMAFGVIVYTFFKFRKVFIQHISFLAGSIVGTCIMFSNGAYRMIFNKEDVYRTIGSGDASEGIIDVIPEQLCLNNVWLNVMLLVVCCVLFYQCKQTIENNKYGRFACPALMVMFAYVVWSVFSVLGLGSANKQAVLVCFEAGFTLLFVASVIAFTVIIGLCCDCLWKMLFWNASILCLTLPLFVVTPIGARCFFITYIMYMLLFMEICCRCQPLSEKFVLNGKRLRQACLCINIVALVFYFMIFSSIAYVDRDRLQHVKKGLAAGEKKIEIKHLPYESYLWVPTPTDREWHRKYAWFHHFPEKQKLIDVYEYGNSKKK